MKKILIGFVLGLALATTIVVIFLFGMNSNTNIENTQSDITYYDYEKIPDFGVLFGVEPAEIQRNPLSTGKTEYIYAYQYDDVKNVYHRYFEVLTSKGYVYETGKDMSGIHTVYYIKEKEDDDTNDAFIIILVQEEKDPKTNEQYIAIRFEY